MIVLQLYYSMQISQFYLLHHMYPHDNRRKQLIMKRLQRKKPKLTLFRYLNIPKKLMFAMHCKSLQCS